MYHARNSEIRVAAPPQPAFATRVILRPFFVGSVQNYALGRNEISSTRFRGQSGPRRLNFRLFRLVCQTPNPAKISGGCGQWTPNTVQCYNMGSDGTDAAWKCEATLPDGYSFSSVEVCNPRGCLKLSHRLVACACSRHNNPTSRAVRRAVHGRTPVRTSAFFGRGTLASSLTVKCSCGAA